MKNTSLNAVVVLSIAVVGLYVLGCTGKKSETGLAGAGKEVDNALKVAYIKVDSLVINYDFALAMHDKFAKQQQSYTDEYRAKRRSFESQVSEFQEKAQRGGFLTQERMNQEQSRLANMEQEVVNLDQEFTNKLAQMQTENNKQLLDSVMNYLKVYNKDKKYDYIFDGAVVLIGDEGRNITKEVLTDLNARYAKVKK